MTKISATAGFANAPWRAREKNPLRDREDCLPNPAVPNPLRDSRRRPGAARIDDRGLAHPREVSRPAAGELGPGRLDNACLRPLERCPDGVCDLDPVHRPSNLNA